MSLSVKVRLALKVPTEFGRKVTVTVQLAPAARLLGQLLVWTNTEGALETMLVIPVAVDPKFVRVMVCGGLVVFICWLPKANNTVDKRKPRVGTMACRVTIFVRFPLLATTVTG
jgi:hypothetical protein